MKETVLKALIWVCDWQLFDFTLSIFSLHLGVGLLTWDLSNNNAVLLILRLNWWTAGFKLFVSGPALILFCGQKWWPLVCCHGWTPWSLNPGTWRCWICKTVRTQYSMEQEES